MKRWFLLILFVLLTLSACHENPPEESTVLSGTVGHTVRPNYHIGVTPTDPVTVCDAAALEGNDLSYSPFMDIETLTENQALYKALRERLAVCNVQNRLEGEPGCFISLRDIATFKIHENSCSNAFFCYIFTKDLEYAGQISFYQFNGDACFNISTAYGSDPFDLRLMKENPGTKYILLSNGYDTMLLDEENTVHAQYTDPFTVIGDYFHALDWEAMAVCYDEIITEDNLLWISFE